MTEMGEGLRASVWLAVIGVLRITGSVSARHESCAELKFEGMPPAEKMVRVEENSYINLTFHLDMSRCGEISEIFLAKVVYKESGFEIELCKLVLYPMCKVTGSSAVCQCLNTRFAQLFLKVRISESKIYTWKWFSSANKASEQQREIWVYSNTADQNITGSDRQIIMIAAVCVGIIVAVVPVFIFWRRSRPKHNAGTFLSPVFTDQSLENLSF